MPQRKIQKKKAATRKAVRTITAADRATINNIAQTVGPMLPLSTYNKKAETIKTIFTESNIQKYIPTKKPKQRAMQEAFVKLFRYHKQLPKSIFRKIVTASISYRNYYRKPLRRKELDQLDSLLQKLGVDLHSEFQAIDLESFVPLITVPPGELIKRLDNHPLCDEIRGEPLELFKNGHFNESVRKATEKFEAEIQVRTGSSDIGKSLMNRTFKVESPTIALNALVTGNERSIQEGFRGLTSGMMQAMRNIFSHGDEDQRPPEEAYEMLLFINWLFKQLP